MSTIAFNYYPIKATINHSSKSNINSSRCSSHPPVSETKNSKLVPKFTIPEGACIEQTWSDSPLLARLDNIRFAYEADQSLPCNQTINNSSSSSPCILRYRCRAGHVIKSIAGSPACKACPICMLYANQPSANTSRQKLSLCQLRAVAMSRGGTLLSTVYYNARTPLQWRCAHGHIWSATASNVRSSNSWCPECARQSKKLTMNDMHQLAKQFNGLCLSNEYISEHVKLRWRCKQGHEFLMAPNNIRRSSNGKRKPSWCKICRKAGLVQTTVEALPQKLCA